MAVYTHLGAEELAELIGHYDVGELRSVKGIAEGVSNSNWLVETSRDRFILTMYERRIDRGDLPFFLGLLDHLSERGCPVPRTIHDRSGAAFRELGGKAVALIEFLPGVSVDRPVAQQAYNVGAALARTHLGAKDFPQHRANQLGPEASARVLASCGEQSLARIDPDLPSFVETAEAIAAQWPADLPQSVIHSDLFPDNVLMLGDEVSGMIDFYFACNDVMAYDLAVTHAAWSFAPSGDAYRPEIGRALIAGYESCRGLEQAEREALPVLAQAACLRFIASRAEDWLDTPADAIVTRKDPMDFARRFDIYAREGEMLFA